MPHPDPPALSDHNISVSEMGVGYSRPFQFTIEQFDRMIDQGVLSDLVDQKIQLYRGEIQLMVPPNPLHDEVIGSLDEWAHGVRIQLSRRSQSQQIRVRCQVSIDLRVVQTVPLPDLVMARGTSYLEKRPGPADILLLIEVSDSTLKHDLGDKASLYAESSISEYWVVDIPNRSLVIHRSPSSGRYRSVVTVDENQPTSPQAIPSVSLKVADLFRA